MAPNTISTEVFGSAIFCWISGFCKLECKGGRRREVEFVMSISMVVGCGFIGFKHCLNGNYSGKDVDFRSTHVHDGVDKVPRWTFYNFILLNSFCEDRSVVHYA
jgi:hypothetical protein